MYLLMPGHNVLGSIFDAWSVDIRRNRSMSRSLQAGLNTGKQEPSQTSHWRGETGSTILVKGSLLRRAFSVQCRHRRFQKDRAELHVEYVLV